MKKKQMIIIGICLAIIGIAIFVAINIYNKSLPQANKRDESSKQIEILTDYINIRESNNTNSQIVGKVYKNEIYNVIDNKDLWIKIQTTNNVSGWIISSYGDDVYVKYLEVNGNIPEEQKKLDKIASKEYLDTKKVKYQKVEWISNIPLTEIKCIKDNGMMNIQPKMFITNSGELYEFSTEKKYSNEQVCKKIDTDVKFDRFNLFANDRDLSIAISTDNQYYYYVDGEFKDYYINDATLRKINNEHPNNYGYYNGGATSYDIYYYVDGNNIYEYKLKINYHGGSKYTLVSDEIIDTIPENEKFISLDGRIIKTDKSYYKLGIKNQEECNKYEDVQPIFGLVKLEDISSEYNKISYFNGNYIIYKEDSNNLYIYRETF